MSLDSEKLAAAMGDVLAMIPTQRRRGGTRQEPEPRHLTDAYAQLVVGYGYAALGDQQRARELSNSAIERFADVASDPVHAYLTAAFRARIDQVCAGMPRGARLPDHLNEGLRALDRIGRYRVDRLRERSRILAPGSPEIDAIADYQCNVASAPDGAEVPWLAHLRSIADHPTRAAEIDRMLVETNLADARLTTCFDALLELSENEALPVLAPAIHRLLTAPGVHVAACVHALQVAARFGYGELAPDLIRRVIGSPEELAIGLASTLRALRRLGAWTEIAEVLDVVGPRSGDAADATGLVVVAGRTLLRADVDASLFNRRRAALETISVLSRTEAIRSIAGAATHGNVDFAIEQVLALRSQYGGVVDSFGTNAAYNLTVLDFVETLVLALVDARLSILNPRDPADASLLAWTFAL